MESPLVVVASGLSAYKRRTRSCNNQTSPTFPYGEPQMFGFKTRRALRNEIAELKAVVEDLDATRRNHRVTIDGLKQERDKIANVCAERTDERDALNDSLQQEQARVEDLETGVRQLKEALGHAIHGLAAFQSFSDGIQKRLAMLPDQLGLPDNLAQDILGEFDQDLQARKAFAADLERQSVTLEHRASDDGFLLNSEGVRTSLNVDQVDDALFGAASPCGEPCPDWDVTIDAGTVTDIKELGLFRIPVDLGKGVKIEVRLWVVPTAS